MVVAAPSDENEARLLLSTCYQHPGPAAVRYPRGAGCGARVGDGLDTVEIGKGEVRHEGGRIAILGFGTRVPEALEAARRMGATMVEMRFVKPPDEALVRPLADTHEAFLTLEEASVIGAASRKLVG